MEYNLSFISSAEVDFVSVIDRYNRVKDGLGYEVFCEIDECLQVLRRKPLLYQKRYKEIRAMYTKRFHFTIFYQVLNQNTILVYAILNQKESIDKLLGRF